ncbi:mitochondrial rRNA methyltransferase 2 [Rhodnius prolixus]|uniref:rRNA methyltransferase 2, mitochondrial n=2 Tax=Rhodnius TaxID=13248 RepID=R4FJT4_RHOPR
MAINCFQKRCISLFSFHFKESHIKLKGKSKSSQEWLLRHLKDPYVEKAKMGNFRCRSAFKLLEIDNKYKLLHPGQCILDCGAAPGSWTQVAVSKSNSDGKGTTKPRGMVIAVDILPILPVEGALVLGRTDLSSEEGLDRVKLALNGRLVDVLLSDMAPNATGVKEADHDSIIHLAYAVVRFGLGVSRTGASLLLKIWDGRSSTQLTNDISRFYNKVKRVKPFASRTNSAELYVLATDFKGLD